MKTLTLFVLFFVVGCAIGPGKGRIEAAKQSEATGNQRPYTPPVSVPVVTGPIDSFPLAWSKEPKGGEWTFMLDEAMSAYPEDFGGIKVPCKKITPKQCAKQLLSVIAKRESNYKPETSYNETGHLQGVVSRGLFQISKDSANQSAYGCNIRDAKQLHTPSDNIKCAVKILAYQARKTGTLIDGEKGGCGAYWSVCRSKNGKSESYKFIMSYMGKF